MLRAAVVGLGWWGKELISRLAGSDRITVTHGVDVNLDAVTELPDTNRLTLTDSYEGVLANGNIDAVILATPHGLHEEQVLAAAAARKQIFCEKPLALEGEAAERMLKACDDQGILLGIGHERRYEPAFEEMKRRVDTGELGTLLHIEINASYNLFAGVVETGWRQDPKQAPAGTLTALGVHLTDYIQTLAGPVSEICARTSHRSSDFPSDDILSVQFAFKSGVTGYLSSIATTPFYQRISVFGDRGWVETREVSNVTDPDPAVMTWSGMDLETHTRTYKPINTVLANLHDWVSAIETSHVYRFTRQEKLHNIQILDAIVRSASSGRPVPVD